MIVGLIADTHDRLPLVEKAVKKLNEENVDLVLHAGDYIAPFVAARFKDLKAKMIGVFGNNDGDHTMLRKKFAEVGIEIRGRFTEVVVDNVKIAVIHGDDTELLQALINAHYHNVIVHGHTHEAKTYRKDGVLVINPGEVCGYLSGKATIALLDTKTLDVKTISLE